MCFEFNMGWRILVFYPEPEASLIYFFLNIKLIILAFKKVLFCWIIKPWEVLSRMVSYKLIK